MMFQTRKGQPRVVFRPAQLSFSIGVSGIPAAQMNRILRARCYSTVTVTDGYAKGRHDRWEFYRPL